MPIYLFKKTASKKIKKGSISLETNTYDLMLSKWWTEINRKKIEFIHKYILSIKSKNGPPTDDELIEFTGWASLNYIASVVEKMGFLKRQGNFFCSTEIMFIVQATLVKSYYYNYKTIKSIFSKVLIFF